MPIDPPSPPAGVLLLQLGTPEAPTAEAVRPYLRQFLTDTRVIELPRLLWRPILELFILTRRPPDSAARYRRIWSEEYGSPLRHFTERQAELLGKELGPGVRVDYAMRYGRPSVTEVLERLLEAGCDRVVGFPMYPQYAASSTASALDDFFGAALARRVVPSILVVPPYFAHPAYLDAVAARFHEHVAALAWKPDHVLITFHGIPVEMVEKGDPYRTHCERTTELLVPRLGLERSTFSQTFQSRFGRAKWLEPYTEDRLRDLARSGTRRVVVVAPGFTADCLETLDEIGNDVREVFQQAGGEHLSIVPCLNDHPAWIAGMAAILRDATARFLG